MPVRFDLNDVLTATEQGQLKDAVGASTAGELEVAATALAKSALREFADQVLGLYGPRSGSDVNERRLMHLIKFLFAGKIPTELQLTRLLKITEANATTLLRNLSARNPNLLRGAYKITVQEIFDGKTRNGNGQDHDVTITSKQMVEWLKTESSRAAPTYGQIVKLRNSNDRYTVPIDTYNELCRALGLNP